LVFVTLGDDKTKNADLKFKLVLNRKRNDQYQPRNRNWGGRHGTSRSSLGFRALL